MNYKAHKMHIQSVLGTANMTTARLPVARSNLNCIFIFFYFGCRTRRCIFYCISTYEAQAHVKFARKYACWRNVCCCARIFYRNFLYFYICIGTTCFFGLFSFGFYMRSYITKIHRNVCALVMFYYSFFLHCKLVDIE